MCANTTPDVPIVVNALPSSATPVPIAAAALSPAPPTTIVPSLSPVSSAIFFVTLPVTSHDSYTLPSIDISMPSVSQTSFDQQRFGTSRSCIPLASETSVAYSPVRINLK